MWLQVGEEARKLFGEAQDMLNEFIANKPVTLAAIVGLYPANSVGDDIEVYTDESRSEVRATLFGLRQQTEKETKTEPCASTACAALCMCLL
jgi:5-methyltetrahydrofolate--homocysteine methyltransferase